MRAKFERTLQANGKDKDQANDDAKSFVTSPYPLNKQNKAPAPVAVVHGMDDCFGSFADVQIADVLRLGYGQRPAALAGSIASNETETGGGEGEEEDASMIPMLPYYTNPATSEYWSRKASLTCRARDETREELAEVNKPVTITDLQAALKNPKVASKISAATLQAKNEFLVVVNQFLASFEALRYSPVNDLYYTGGEFKLRLVLLSFVVRGATIQMVLPAFPCKSPNAVSKVLGKLPDRGEELALLRLEAFCQEVSSYYPPGCEVVIMTDGKVFADLIGAEVLLSFCSFLTSFFCFVYGSVSLCLFSEVYVHCFSPPFSLTGQHRARVLGCFAGAHR